VSVSEKALVSEQALEEGLEEEWAEVMELGSEEALEVE
jgi:hypothetical protein